MKKIAIICAGGFAREIKMLIDQINSHQLQYEFVGYYDDGFKIGDLVNNFPVLGAISDLNEIKEPLYVVLANGTPKHKKQIIESLNNDNLIFENLIHPNVLFDYETSVLGYGNIICASCIVTVNVKIHNFVTLNLACTVGHDTILEDYVSVMPMVPVSGEVILQEGAYIGTGAKIINQVVVGKNSIIGSGAVVSKSIPENCTAVGIPAKPIKFHTNE
jgi:sugar O-acyltransferase (sialic acid O-acetyltransferase NeuD family)